MIVEYLCSNCDAWERVFDVPTAGTVPTCMSGHELCPRCKTLGQCKRCRWARQNARDWDTRAPRDAGAEGERASLGAGPAPDSTSEGSR